MYQNFIFLNGQITFHCMVILHLFIHSLLIGIWLFSFYLCENVGAPLAQGSLLGQKKEEFFWEQMGGNWWSSGKRLPLTVCPHRIHFLLDASFPLLSKEGRFKQDWEACMSYRLWRKDSEPGSLLGRAGILALLRLVPNGLIHLTVLQCPHLLDGTTLVPTSCSCYEESSGTCEPFIQNLVLCGSWRKQYWRLYHLRVKAESAGDPGARTTELYLFIVPVVPCLSSQDRFCRSPASWWPFPGKKESRIWGTVAWRFRVLPRGRGFMLDRIQALHPSPGISYEVCLGECAGSQKAPFYIFWHLSNLWDATIRMYPEKQLLKCCC